ncbi:MAG: hypothetical protein M3209_08550 [Acidobacteriota bacterium]|nr:hypothetical protein [Acidobacteriota bacterium]
MIKFNSYSRITLTILTATLFLAVPFLVSLPTAKMQSGTNNIAFSRYYGNHNYKILTVNADGTGETEIAAGFDPTWSPNGQELALVRTMGGETSDIFLVGADGTNLRQLTQTFQAYSPAWSPNGNQIAFESSHEAGWHVYIINTNGSNQQRLPVPSYFIGEHGPVWTPDGSKIIFIGDRSVDGLRRSDFYSVKPDGSELTRLTNLNALLEFGTPGISSDGSKLLFEYQHDIYSVTTDGSGVLTNITNHGNSTDSNPAFAPNGEKIVFERSGFLHIMNADGSNATSLNVVGMNPAWNPTAILPSPSPTPTPTVTPTPVTADISVQLSVSAATVQVGDEAVYTIKVKNNGTSTATNVTLADTLPAQVNRLAMIPSQGACFASGNQINCQIGTLAVNQEETVQLKVSPNTAGTIVNSVSAGAAETDPDTSNNQASVTFTAVGDCAQNITTPYEITRAQWKRHERNGIDELILTVKNRSDRTLHPRIIFVFDGLPQGVTVDSSVLAGYTRCAAPIGSPFVIGEAPNGREWRPGQQATVRVFFKNPQRLNIPINQLRVMNGPANP